MKTAYKKRNKLDPELNIKDREIKKMFSMWAKWIKVINKYYNSTRV